MSLLRRTSWDKFAALRHFKFFFFLIEDVGNTSTIYLCSSHPGTTNVFFCATVLKAGGHPVLAVCMCVCLASFSRSSARRAHAATWTSGEPVGPLPVITAPTTPIGEDGIGLKPGGGTLVLTLDGSALLACYSVDHVHVGVLGTDFPSLAASLTHDCCFVLEPKPHLFSPTFTIPRLA